MAPQDSRKTIATIVLGTLGIILVALIGFVFFAPTGSAEGMPAGFSPLRDDALANRFQPVFICPPEYGPIVAIYYRAATDASGLVHIAYHPVWSSERNDSAGLAPFFSRALYTGGLSLQRLMFGKGDVESVALSIDHGSGTVVAIQYERAKDYDPSSFSVTHEEVEERGDFTLPLVFEVMSWNHLFSHSKAIVEEGSQVPVQYFTPALWQEYGMQKYPPTRVRKDRAHFAWERGADMD